MDGISKSCSNSLFFEEACIALNIAICSFNLAKQSYDKKKKEYLEYAAKTFQYIRYSLYPKYSCLFKSKEIPWDLHVQSIHGVFIYD